MDQQGIEDRFWAKVCKTSCGCWLWLGADDGQGYGQFQFATKRDRVHRIAWQMLRGPIPDGFELDHRVCRVKSCVNPDHMVICTMSENVLQPDGGAGRNKHKTHCNHGHQLTGDNLKITKEGWRRCVVCIERRHREQTERRIKKRIEQYGVPNRHKRYVDANEISTLYRSGKSVRQIARLKGVSSTVVYDRLRDTGTQMREPGRHAR